MSEGNSRRYAAAKGKQILGRRSEVWLAVPLFALPLAYLITEHSWAPVFWHYSRTLLLAIVGYGICYALFLLSYRIPLPLFFERARSLVVLLGFWVFAAVVGTEALLALIDERPNVKTIRLRGYAPDPDTGYVYIPNYEQRTVHLEGSGVWRTNAQGVRADRDYGPKPDGVKRILAVGDSFTVAARVALEDSWPGVLERRLNEDARNGERFEVVNAGHAGYGTLQQLAWLRKFGDQFSADMVVLALTPNDITDHKAEPPAPFKAVDGYLAERTSNLAHKRVWEHHLQWYSLPGYLRRSHIWEQIQRIRIQLAGDSRLPRLAACQIEFGEEEHRLHKMTERSILGIRDWIADRGGRFAIILLTFREQLGEMAPGYDPGKFTRYWSRFAEERGIPVISTYDAFRSHPQPQTLYWRWDHHYNATGSRISGELATKLVKRAWLGG